MAGLNTFLEQAKLFWSGLTAKQRIMLGGGAVLTAAVLVFFVRMMATPEYKPLFTGLESADAQSLLSQLSAKNIPAKLGADGKSIAVPADQLDSARMEVATQGMPHSGRLGFELFDKLSWGQTEFDEKVNYQRALEGELERTIQTLRDVESARVHLVMPTDSVFIDRQKKAKASVILKLRRGSVARETQLAIARLLSGAVNELNPEDVSVVDADTGRPLMASQGSSGSASIEDQLTERLLHTLEPIVGPQRVRASVNVEYDPTTTEESQEKYDPATAVAVTMQKSEERIGGATLGGVPGTSSNVPGSTAAVKTSVTDDGTQSSRSESNTYAVNKVVRHTLEPAGRIRRVSAALLIDDATEMQQQAGKSVPVSRKRTPEELKQIQELASAAIGLDASRGDVLSVQNLSFQRTGEPAPVVPTKLERVRTTLNDWSSVVRYAALLILFLLAYLLMLRPVKKYALGTLKRMPLQAGATAEQDGLAGGLGIGGFLDGDPRSASMKKQLLEKIKSEPASGGRLVEAWLREE